MGRTELSRRFEKGIELDFTVTEHIRIRRTALFILAEHIVHHALTVLCAQVHEIKRDAYLSSHHLRHELVLLPLAVAVKGAFRIVPILHKHREHIIALLLQAVPPQMNPRLLKGLHKSS